MRNLTLKLVLVPPTVLVFYIWLAIFLSENAIYLPLSVQISALNSWLGNVEWLFLYLWLVVLLYITIGEKLSERRRKLKRSNLGGQPTAKTNKTN